MIEPKVKPIAEPIATEKMNQADLDRANYDIYNEEIRRAKNQQWQMTYYAILLQAALITFRVLISDYIVYRNRVFYTLITISIILSVVVLVVGCIVIDDYKTKLEEYRELNKGIKKKIRNGAEPKIPGTSDITKVDEISIKIEDRMGIIFYSSGLCSAVLAIIFIIYCK